MYLRKALPCLAVSNLAAASFLVIDLKFLLKFLSPIQIAHGGNREKATNIDQGATPKL